MNDFFASAADSGALRATLELLSAESRALVLTDGELRVTAMTEGAKSLLDCRVLRPLAELLSAEVVEALRGCLREQSGTVIAETIDEAPYRVHARACAPGLLLHLEPAFDLYRTALEEFELHRIRDALSSLLLAAQRLGDHADTTDAGKLAAVVRRQGMSIHRVLMHADALTAPPAGFSPDFSEGDLAVLCRDLQERAEKLCGTKIGFTVDAPRSCPAIFDVRLITQALCNLIVNAAGAPDVTAVTLRLTRTDGEMLLSVADDGRGLPGEALPRLYEGWRMLQTSERALSEQADGISWGLGLPLVHRIAGAHGGMLLWSPGKPQGCVFTLCLPEKHSGARVLAQPALRIRDGFDIMDIELSALPQE